MPVPGQDPSQDQDFLKAPPAQQHAYLMDTDQDYAKANPNDQKAYLQHVTGPTSEGALDRQTSAAARGAGESQRATMPELPKPEPTGPVTRFAAGAVDQAKTLIPSMPKTLSGLALQTAGIAYPGLTQGLSAAQEYENARKQGQGIIPSVGAGAGAASGVDVAGVRERAKRGDVAGVLGETAAAVAPMVLARPLSRVAEVVNENPTVQKVTSTITKPIRGPLDTLGLTAREPEKALTQAIQPGVNIPRAQESMPIAGPDLQYVKKAGLVTDREGNPITEFKSNGDLLHGARAAKTYIWDNLEKRTGSVAQLSTATDEAADAMVNSISQRTRDQFPQIAKQIEDRAATLRGTRTFRQIENHIQDANDDLGPLYNRGNANPNNASTSAEIRATEAEVKVMRRILDEGVEKLTGEGTADLKQRYGAIRDVERAAAKQHAIETRVKGATMWEGLAALRAAGDFVSGNVLRAAKGAATLAVGRRLGLVRTPGWLIDQAFQGSKAFAPSAEIAAPPGVKIAGELGPGPTVTPPPADKSGPVDLGKPTVLPLAENRQLPAAGRATGPQTVAGPGQYPISLPETTPRPLTGPERQLPEKASTGRDESFDVPLGKQWTNQKPPAFKMPRSSLEEGGNTPPTLNKPTEPPPKAGPAAPVTERPSPKPVTKAAKAAKPPLSPESEINDLRFKMRDLEKRINKAHWPHMTPLVERYRKFEARMNELVPPKEEVFGAASQRQKGGQKTGEEVPTRGAAGADVKVAAPTPKDVLPGMGQAVEENKAAAGKHQAEEMTRQSNRPAENIAAAAGEMETKSPLFRGTEASPQKEIFGNAPPAMKRDIPATERRSTVRLGTPLNINRTYLLNDMRAKLQSGELSPEAHDILQRQYVAMKAHPEDMPIEGDLKSLKVQPEKMTQEEAEAEQAKRHEPPPAKTEPPTLKPVSRSERLKTYNSLSARDREGVDAELEGLKHMPQILREGRELQLKGFGGPGTYLKERLAREFLEDQKKPKYEREPGED